MSIGSGIRPPLCLQTPAKSSVVCDRCGQWWAQSCANEYRRTSEKWVSVCSDSITSFSERNSELMKLAAAMEHMSPTRKRDIRDNSYGGSTLTQLSLYQRVACIHGHKGISLATWQASRLPENALFTGEKRLDHLKTPKTRLRLGFSLVVSILSFGGSELTVCKAWVGVP